MKEFKKIGVVGRGNVGKHFSALLNSNGLNVSLIDSRTLDGIETNFDLIIIAVSDHAIEEVSTAINQKLPSFEGIVVHTAGSVGIEKLSGFNHFGVLYPLQTFSKEMPLDNGVHRIPLLIEGNDEETTRKLKIISEKISKDVFECDSRRRAKIHLAAVFSCNFSNAMYRIAEEILQENGLPFSIMHPLILQTAEKAIHMSPYEAQTGPAIRKDLPVIESHLKLLGNDARLMNIYNEITQYITNTPTHE